MKEILLKYKNILLVILSAVLVGISFTFDELSLVMWVAFTPFLYVFLTSVKTYRNGIKYGMIFGAIYYFIVLHWIFNLYPLDWMNINNRDSIVILVIGWIFISVVEGLVIGIIVGLFPLVKVNDNRYNIIILAMLWVIMEWVLGIGSLAFTWGRLAVSQVTTLSIVQSTSLFGSLFISLLILIINGLIVLTIVEYIKSKKINKYYLILAIVLFMTNMGFGVFRLSQSTEGKEVDVTVVQGNINTAQKWESNSHKDILKQYQIVTNEAMEDIKQKGEKSKMLFWPETVVPVNLSNFPSVRNEYVGMAKYFDVHFMTGAFYTEFDEVEKDHNSIYSISKDGEIGKPYSKRQLVPFGETLPFKDFIYKIIPALKKANLFGNIYAGEEAIVAETEFGKVGSVICFESIFPRLVLDTVRNGAELIFIATNDSWFKDSRAVYQHNNNAVLRAIEMNRYVVRAANTGISSVINNKGEVISSIEPLKTGYINSEVQFMNNRTLYSKIGNIIVVIAIIGIITIKISKKQF